MGLELKEQLKALSEIGIALSSELNLTKLLARIVKEAREFTNAEAGSLYTVENEKLHFRIAQNDALPGQGSTYLDKVLPLTKESIAGYVGITGEIVNLEDVYEIPTDRPFSFNDEFDRANDYRTQSMLLVPLREPSGRILGVLQLINARLNGEVVPFDSEYEDLCSSLASQAAVALRNARLRQELKDAYLDTILRLAKAAEYRDQDTGQHLQRISEYSALLATEIGFDDEKVEEIKWASIMHDIGKIGISDDILMKPGKLTSEEFDEMKRHTVIGSRILADSDVPLLQLSEQIARTHHEKWDGSGYPNGLEGEDIPIYGRIVALADVFDALTSKRCYKPAFAVEQAIQIIDSGSGSHFDPQMVEAFHRCLDNFLQVRERLSTEDAGDEGGFL